VPWPALTCSHASRSACAALSDTDSLSAACLLPALLPALRCCLHCAASCMAALHLVALYLPLPLPAVCIAWPTCLVVSAPSVPFTGAITGMFVADCGFTCSWYDDELEQLAVGTDRGIVHSLDLGLQPRSMPVAAAHTPAAGAGQLPPATDEQGQGQPQAEPNAAGAGGEGAGGPAAAVNSAAAQQSQRDAGLPGKGAAAAMPPPPAGAAASQLQGAGSQELQAPPSPAEVEVTASRAVRRSRSPSPARPAVADGN
jgi:hypothetical protein